MMTKKNNIAEYILHLWQMEDLVRAFPDDAALLQTPELRDLKEMMLTEGVMKTGHVQIAQNALAQLEEFMEEVLTEDATMRAALLAIQPSLNLLKAKSDNPTQSDLNMMFVFLYNIMILRLKKQPISDDTLALQKQISHFLAQLSLLYKKNE